MTNQTVWFENGSMFASLDDSDYGRIRNTMEHKISITLVVYVTPLLILAGTIGNMLSCVVLMRRCMRTYSIYFYMAILACADTSVLFFSALRSWIRVVADFELMHLSNASCKLFMFAFFLGLHMSAWFVVCLTADRFVAIWFPLKVSSVCLFSRAIHITFGFAAILAVYNAHVFWSLGLQATLKPSLNGAEYECKSAPENIFMNTVFPFLNLATYSIIPFLTVVVLNAFVIFKLSTGRRQEESVSDNGVATGSASSNSNRSGSTFDVAKQRRITFMLLTVSITWLLLTAPFTIFSLLPNRATNDYREKARLFLTKTICFLLMYLNHSINFYLYCLSGKKFRRELCRLFSSWSGSTFRRNSSQRSTFRLTLLARQRSNGTIHSLLTPQPLPLVANGAALNNANIFRDTLLRR